MKLKNLIFCAVICPTIYSAQSQSLVPKIDKIIARLENLLQEDIRPNVSSSIQLQNPLVMKPVTFVEKIIGIKPVKPIKSLIPLQHINLLRFQIGTIKQVSKLKKAKNPSYEMELFFGDMGTKTSCGQFVNNYSEKDLTSKQVLTITNFPTRRMSGVKSEVLTLGFPDKEGSHQAICLVPYEPSIDGSCINACRPPFKEDIDYRLFLETEIKSGTIKELKEVNGHQFAVVDLGDKMGLAAALIPSRVRNLAHYTALQVPVLINLEPTPLDNEVLYHSILLTACCSNDEGVEEKQAIDNNNYSSIIVIDKTVQNGLDLF